MPGSRLGSVAECNATDPHVYTLWWRLARAPVIFPFKCAALARGSHEAPLQEVGDLPRA
jgi:hypothetical protein